MNQAKVASAFNLTSQTALITGGGTGLGFGMARCLAAAGAKVVLVGRRKEELDKACAEIGANAFAVQGDVTKLEMVPAIVDAAEKLAGPIAILINNAGVHLKKFAADTTDAEFANVMQTRMVYDGTYSGSLGSFPEVPHKMLSPGSRRGADG